MLGVAAMGLVVSHSGLSSKKNMWVFPKTGVPQNGWFIMERTFKMDDLGVPLFSETSMYHLCFNNLKHGFFIAPILGKMQGFIDFGLSYAGKLPRKKLKDCFFPHA